MRITLEVSGAADTAGASSDLRQWLRRDPELRGRIGRASVVAPAPGTMGATAELIPLLLAPGGLTAALAAAVVAWLQSRRGNQTVTITKPDGTQVVVTSEGVQRLTPEATGDLAQRVAQALQPPPEPTQPEDRVGRAESA